jgi:hypothetical protein
VAEAHAVEVAEHRRGVGLLHRQIVVRSQPAAVLLLVAARASLTSDVLELDRSRLPVGRIDPIARPEQSAERDDGRPPRSRRVP